MKKFLAIMLLTILTACANVPSLTGQLKTGYDTVAAYVDLTSNSLQRGRISIMQAEKASANSKKVLATLDQANIALSLCKVELPCTDYLNLLQALQPSLLELEMELRKTEGEKK